ncbi:MAG: transglutaminase domain-containing protein, partial [Acidobacteria bacterium]|nr:transglutaminase domain-containing protein [Acidobacteriota bacterium]
MKRSAFASLCLAAALVAPALATTGVVVAGSDRARILLPPGVDVVPYSNQGYDLRVEDGVATIDVDLSPLRSQAPFQPVLRAEPTAVERVAGAVTWGSRSRLEAANRLLAWVAGNVRYRLDRSASQEARDVLERRSAYCTGYARLGVALLEAVGIEAREVAGYVAGERPGTGGAGFHRWIEIRYPDRGWVFSDPMASLGFVDATYLRIASDRLSIPAPGDGLVIERDDRTVAIDIAPETQAVALR